MSSMDGDSERAALTGVIAGFIDSVVTIGALVAASSSVLLADSLKTLLEFLAVLLSYLAIRRVHRGGSNYFEYGLHKLENLSSLLVSVVMFVCLAIIVVNAAINILHPSHIAGVGVWISIVAQIVYGIINGLLYRKNRDLARREGSPMFQSQARLFLTKALANGFILVSLGLSLLLARYPWSAYIDPLAALGVAASILIPAMNIFSNSFCDLLDRTAEESHKLVILREFSPFVHMVGLHEFRTRRAGKMVFIDLTLEFDGDVSVHTACQTIEKLRACIERSVPHSKVSVGLTELSLQDSMQVTLTTEAEVPRTENGSAIAQHPVNRGT